MDQVKRVNVPARGSERFRKDTEPGKGLSALKKSGKVFYKGKETDQFEKRGKRQVRKECGGDFEGGGEEGPWTMKN